MFVDYIMAFGTWIMLGFIVTLFGGSLFEAFSNVWLARWSSEKDVDAWSPMANLSVYGFFGFGNCKSSFSVRASGVFGDKSSWAFAPLIERIFKMFLGFCSYYDFPSFKFKLFYMK